MKIRFFSFLFLSLFFFFYSCNDKEKETKIDTLFNLKSAKESGINFNNKLFFTEDYNPYTFKNFFNGGGVAIGDINNDGLAEIFFAGNLVDNKLYLNKGNLIFEDITAKAGVTCKDVWSTGVSFVDINADGYLDIYICKSGKPGGKNRHNELFINNKNLTFTEMSREYGLDFTGLSTHAAFFDMDRDGDLDCYLLNNSIRSVGGYDIVEGLREMPDIIGGNKLLRNDKIKIIGGQKLVSDKTTFKDITIEAGIYSSEIGFGLGVSVSDINGDDWPDLYVSNDFFERDYLYINNQNGGFFERLNSSIEESSMGSMGADIADINNDGQPDIFVTEMLPRDMTRYKSKAVFESWDKYHLNVSKGYHKQFSRNVLQLNQGNDENENVKFSEISRLCKMDATDWSWGALAADFNNTGMNDIYVANGIYKDLTDLDYVNFKFNPEKIREMMKDKKNVITKMMEEVPSTPLSNCFFINKGNLSFEESAAKSGLAIPSFSNGSAYGDLDNDGDLDLVVNNINEDAFLFENNSNTSKNHFVNIKLIGSEQNLNAIGSKLLIFQNGKIKLAEINPMRGFESCVDDRIHIGLGQSENIDSILITWPQGQKTILKNIIKDSFYVINFENQKMIDLFKQEIKIRPILTETKNIIEYDHHENHYTDFDRDRLLYYMLSNEGPCSAVSDIDGNGMEDIVVGGNFESQTICFLQQSDGRFIKKNITDFQSNATFEVTDILIEDFNEDGKKDIFLCSGGCELPATSSLLKDRLYLQKGNSFVEDATLFSGTYMSSSSAIYLDINGDNRKDIVTSTRLEPFAYGVPVHPVVYLNKSDHYVMDLDQSKLFFDVNMTVKLDHVDLDKDGQDEIIFMQDLGSMKIFSIGEDKRYHDVSESWKIVNTKGYWSSFELGDTDGDGDTDILVCNKGLNNRFASASNSRIEMIVNDFDQNGQIEQIMCYNDGKKTYPWVLRDDIMKQIPQLKKKFLGYEDFSKATMQDMIPKEIMDRSIVYEANELRSGIFRNDGNIFTFIPLPMEAQISDMKTAVFYDINNDEKPDIILGGNQFNAKPEIGIDAASYSEILINKGNNVFIALPKKESCFFIKGQIRDIKIIKIMGKENIVFLRNNDSLKLYKPEKSHE